MREESERENVVLARRASSSSLSERVQGRGEEEECTQEAVEEVFSGNDNGSPPESSRQRSIRLQDRGNSNPAGLQRITVHHQKHQRQDRGGDECRSSSGSPVEARTAGLQLQ